MSATRSAVVAVVVLAAATLGAPGRADAAADVIGSKVLKRDCTLQMRSGRGENVPTFTVTEVGSGCGNYLVRGVSIATTNGGYDLVGLQFLGGDQDHDPRHEELTAHGPAEDDSFSSGNVTVYAPYRARCDRYRMNGSGTVTHLDAWPCHGSAYPPGVKAFLKDCSLNAGVAYERDALIQFGVVEYGTECGDYELVGISITSADGLHEFANGPDADDPETLGAFTQGTYSDAFAYGDVAVHIPYRSRCDRYRFGPDLVVRYIGSWRCSGT